LFVTIGGVSRAGKIRRPSAAKAAVDLVSFTARLEAAPFQSIGEKVDFSATSKAAPFPA
jgi:hypothetical protein